MLFGTRRAVSNVPAMTRSYVCIPTTYIVQTYNIIVLYAVREYDPDEMSRRTLRPSAVNDLRRTPTVDGVFNLERLFVSMICPYRI